MRRFSQPVPGAGFRPGLVVRVHRTSAGHLPRAFLALLVAAITSLAVYAGAGAPAFAADTGCPNGQLRDQQGSTYLPDCRAFEQVSPTDKNGNHVVFNSNVPTDGRILAPTVSSPDGNAVTFGSHGAFAGSTGGTGVNGYAAFRSAGSWQTSSLVVPIWAPEVITRMNVVGTSPDLTTQLVETKRALAPGATEGIVNVYLHRLADDSYQFVGSDPTSGLTVASFAMSSPDGGIWYFEEFASHFASTPAPANGTTVNDGNLYRFDADTGALTLAGVLPGGAASPTGSWPADALYTSSGVHNDFVARRPVSADGAQVFWSPAETTNPTSPQPLYLTRNGQSTLVTERETDASTQNARFWFATPEGDQAFLTSNGALTSDASPSGFDLYRYDRDANSGAGDLVDLTPTASSADVEAVLGVSNDGTYVYFVSTSDLTGAGTAGQHNLYVWHTGDGIRLIATSAAGFSTNAGQPAGTYNDTNGILTFRVSPNGRYLGFILPGALTGPHPEPDPGAEQAYRYDYQGDSLVCASCPSAGLAAGSARFQRINADNNILGKNDQGLTRNVLDDGRLFFETPVSLVPGDTNGHSDVYEYSTGQPRLISTGQSAQDSYFGDASPSGDDVYFATLDRLVAQDSDALYDLYDARVDGGLPSQNPLSDPGCSGDACQGSATVQVQLPVAGSVAFLGADGGASVRVGSGKVRVSKAGAITGTTGSLKVKVPGKGRLTVSGSGLQTRRSSPSKARTVTVRLTLSKVAAKSLKRKRNLKLRVKVAFTDSGGETSTARLSVTFRVKAHSTRKGR